MIALVALAAAADLTWTCPPVASPEDAAVFRDVSTLGVAELIDSMKDVGGAWFTDSCPGEGWRESDACFTEAGDAIGLAVTETGFALTIVPASGDLARLSLNLDERSFIDTERSGPAEETTASVAWSGTADPAWPADQTLTLSTEEGAGFPGPVEWRSAAWDDGSCAWSAAEEDDPTDPLAPHTWSIEADGHTLEVTEATPDTCHPTGTYAIFDRVTLEIEPGTWEPLRPREGDEDGDGWLVEEGDCDDTRADRHPCATDIECDGIDQDCDGADVVDCDGDGYDPLSAGGDDCDDTDPMVHPGARDMFCDDEDTDCDGMDGADNDGDGWSACDDCNDKVAEIHPGADDPPGDVIDQDCDGVDGTAVDTGDTADSSPPEDSATPSDTSDTSDASDASDAEKREVPRSSSGCASAPAGGWIMVGIALTALRRRR